MGRQGEGRADPDQSCVNAVKFTEQGKVSLRVTQQTETDTHRVVRFEVSDTGIGIAQEDRLLLFEKFSQVEAGSTRRFGGVGLGLATARHLIEAMGGLIDVDSVPGSGSTFWFTLSFPKEAAGRPIASSDLTFQGTRVLLVDSVLTSRKIVRHYLEHSWEMRVDATGSGAEALAMLKRAADSDPYRVLLYERMAEVDELALAREVRVTPRIAGTRLVVMIPAGSEVNEERLRQAGIHAYVAKPVGQSELYDAMTIALAREALPLPRSAMTPLSRTTRPATGDRGTARVRARAAGRGQFPEHEADHEPAPSPRLSGRVGVQWPGGARGGRPRRPPDRGDGLPDADHGWL
jgi:Signal transduction histidine kinase